MSDEADLSQESMEKEAEIRRKYATPSKLEVDPIGTCLNCGESVASGVRWCDKDCQDDWIKRRG
jgi:hypothetical protein